MQLIKFNICLFFFFLYTISSPFWNLLQNCHTGYFLRVKKLKISHWENVGFQKGVGPIMIAIVDDVSGVAASEN